MRSLASIEGFARFIGISRREPHAVSDLPQQIPVLIRGRKGEEVHMARAHGIIVEKHSPLADDEPKRKY